MTAFRAVFAGDSPRGRPGTGGTELWVTDGTSAGTSQLTVTGFPGVFGAGDVPEFTTLGTKTLFEGLFRSGSMDRHDLWVTDGTAAGTSELVVAGTESDGLFGAGSTGVGLTVVQPDFGVLGNRALLEGFDARAALNLWVTDGTPAGTYELTVAGANSHGLFYNGSFQAFPDFTVFGSKALFEGYDTTGNSGLWVTDGTSAGTSELTVAGASSNGLFVNVANASFFVFGTRVLFAGVDASDRPNLWVTDGTSTGTSELAASSFGLFSDIGNNPVDFTVLGSKVLFQGEDANGHVNLWVTDGTSAGTSELTVAGGYSFGLFYQHLNPDFTVLGNKVLFQGYDASGKDGLWVTDGTSAGTSELTVTGASSNGLLFSNNPEFTVLGGQALFEGWDASGNVNVWVTDGTLAGTHELTVAGTWFRGLLSGSDPGFTVLGSKVLFSGRDAAGNFNPWVTDGTSAGTSEVTVAGLPGGGLFPAHFSVLTTSVSPDLPWQTDGNSIFLQNDAGPAAIWTVNGTSFIGGGSLPNPGPSWHAKAPGDFNGDGSPDILWQNDSGAVAVWLLNGTTVIGGGSLGNPGPSWQVASVGDFNGDGRSDILWQDSSGAVAIWELNGASIIGGGSLGNPGPSWHAVGSGDFNADGKSDILWQNDSGQVVVWELNGTSIVGGGNVANPGASWHALGAGDFNGDGRSDILLQNDSGQVAIWEMNGSSLIGGGNVANPGPSWHVMGVGDYNSDGKSDILLQNSSGDVAIWEMNGTSIIGGGIIANPGPTWHI
jgi:ELWxxDGT repeat protein